MEASQEETQQDHEATTRSSSENPKPSFPAGRVKKIMKLDRDIKKVNSEALHLVSVSVDLFLASLAERARAAALAKKKRTIKLDHLRTAVRNHPPTSEFLLDCLPESVLPESAPAVGAEIRQKSVAVKPLPPGARRIEDFFGKRPENRP